MKKAIGLFLITAITAVGCGPDVGPARKNAIKDYQLGNVQRAKTGFTQVLSLKPADPDALFYMGLIASREEKHKNAAYYFRACLDADPSRSLAKMFLEQEEREVAREDAALIGPPLKSPYGLQDPNAILSTPKEDDEQTPTTMPENESSTSMPSNPMDQSPIPEES